MTTENAEHDELPDAIVERLRAREHRVTILTPAADRAIERAAQRHFAPRGLPQTAGRRWHYPAAVAAALALVALFVLRPPEPAGIETEYVTDDVDGSGQVDILDAFALARARNRDPDTVSQERIDRLADRIVSLGSPEVVL